MGEGIIALLEIFATFNFSTTRMQFKLSTVSLLPNALPSIINSIWGESYYTLQLFLFHIIMLENSDCIVTFLCNLQFVIWVRPIWF